MTGTKTGFETTHWSVVLAAGESGTPRSREALDKLCRTYWQPIYVYLRRTGRSGEDASDLTQAFFAHLLERKAIAVADPQRGRFRSFLLASLKHFLAHEHERAQALKRGGGQSFVSLDELTATEREAIEPGESLTPEALFDRRWATQQVERSLEKIRGEYESTGRGALFDLLKGYVWGDKNTMTLAEIASELDLTEEAVKKAVQRLRQRFRASLRAEIAQTLASPDQLDEELRHLRAVLSQPP